MSNIHSTVTDLPLSCKSAAEHMTSELKKEETYAELSESCCKKITDLEQTLTGDTGENIVLVAYRV